MVNTGIIGDMGKQRAIQILSGCVVLLGLALWYFKVTIFGHSIGEFIAAAAIVLFAVATVHWFDDEELLEKENKK